MPQRVRAVAEAIRLWSVDQRQKLRRLRRACLPLSLMLLAFGASSAAFVLLVPTPAAIRIALYTALALLPLLIAFCWLIRIPDIWDIHAGWVAALSLVGSLPLVVLGRYFAAATLNELFREAPDLFPIAQTVASYLGVLLVALGVLVVAGLAITIALAGWVLVAGLLHWRGWRRFMRDMAAYLGATLLIGWGLGSIAHLEQLAGKLIARVALEADFHPEHRCDMSGWPAGVTRVAFVGDEQVLGYRPGANSVVPLSCRRLGISRAAG